MNSRKTISVMLRASSSFSKKTLPYGRKKRKAETISTTYDEPL
jgi:hypothetical protein